jgi:hypothetical protein
VIPWRVVVRRNGNRLLNLNQSQTEAPAVDDDHRFLPMIISFSAARRTLVMQSLSLEQRVKHKAEKQR